MKNHKIKRLQVGNEHNVEDQQRPVNWIDELTLSVEDERPTQKKHFHSWATPDPLLGTWIVGGCLLNLRVMTTLLGTSNSQNSPMA
jgi:hypothetical protein